MASGDSLPGSSKRVEADRAAHATKSSADNTVEIHSLRRYDAAMAPTAPAIRIAEAAHHLQLQWRTVEPQQLEDTARELMLSSKLSQLAPAQAVECWLKRWRHHRRTATSGLK